MGKLVGKIYRMVLMVNLDSVCDFVGHVTPNF
jgi:hypothetical protein